MAEGGFTTPVTLRIASSAGPFVEIQVHNYRAAFTFQQLLPKVVVTFPSLIVVGAALNALPLVKSCLEAAKTSVRSMFSNEPVSFSDALTRIVGPLDIDVRNVVQPGDAWLALRSVSFEFKAGTPNEIKMGFNVEILGTVIPYLLSKAAYFMSSLVPQPDGSYNISLSVPLVESEPNPCVEYAMSLLGSNSPVKQEACHEFQRRIAASLAFFRFDEKLLEAVTRAAVSADSQLLLQDREVSVPILDYVNPLSEAGLKARGMAYLRDILAETRGGLLETLKTLLSDRRTAAGRPRRTTRRRARKSTRRR